MIQTKNKPAYQSSLDRSTRPELVDISLDNGANVAAPYTDLRGVELTVGRLLVVFEKYKVTLEGSNLKPLYNAFAQKAVKFIEPTPIASRNGDHTIISRIHVAGLG